MRPVLGTALRRPDLDLLSGAQFPGDVGLDRTSGFRIDAACPVHPLERLGGNQFAS